MGEPLPAKVVAYLAAHNVATLATAGPDGPWASAVFFAADGADLIFLSSPKSRHGRNLAADPRCAATVQSDYQNWTEIKGVQLEGRVTPLSGADEVCARLIYQEKFPFVKPVCGIAAPLAKALAGISWYRLHVERMLFLDNSLGFGHRDELIDRLSNYVD